MPITYLDVPKGIRIEEKNKLVKAICAALHEAYPYPDDVWIFLREWRPDSVSQDGQLGSESVRPVFMMHVPEGANIDAKRKMLRKINDAIVEAYHLPKFMIFMQEYPLTVWRSMAAFIPTTRRVSRPRKRSIATKEQRKMSVPDNEETLNGRPVIATGGSRGLGRSIFEELLARGADVTVVARDERELAEVAPWSTP